jgi:transcription initiation factor IIE alpha subunit
MEVFVCTICGRLVTEDEFNEFFLACEDCVREIEEQANKGEKNKTKKKGVSDERL